MQDIYALDFAEAMALAKKELQADGLGVFVMTFGCQQNENDSERLYGMARALGYLPVSRPEDASLILVNTCAIREHAEQKALSLIGTLKHIKAEKAECVIGVCGCMSAVSHRVELLKAHYHFVDFTLSPTTLHLLPAALLAHKRTGKRQIALRAYEGAPVEGIPICRTHQSRGQVSIMYGCNNFCSYCIVPHVRLRERSRDEAAIVAEVRALIDGGCRDITLLGQNVNSYKGKEGDFASLLARLDALDGDFRLHFMTSHPKDASSDLLRVMQESIERGGHIVSHLHLPMQSGSDRILRKMNRHYDMARYRAIVEEARERMPDISLSTDIIVGFPTETEEDYLATEAALSEFRFDLVYSFIYSPRKGTPAAEMDGQVEEKEKHARYERLLAVQDPIAAERAKRFENRTVRVLMDEQKEDGKYSARTDEYKLVRIENATDSDLGQMKNVRITRAEAFILYGEIEKNDKKRG